MDFAAEGFFEGLDEHARGERRELLDWLTAEGFSDDQLRRAHRRGLLLFLASEREVGGAARFTADDVARESGADPELLARLRRAQGLAIPEPGAVELTDVDLAAARTSAAFLDLGLTEEQMVATSRVLGRSLSTAAEAMRSVMLEVVLEPGDSEAELAQRYAAAVHEIMPLVGPMVLQMLSQQLRNIVQGEMVGAVERATGTLPGARDQAVAFADLVGFTRLGEEIAPEDLGTVATRLEAIAREVVAPPVRLVKTIGDAVMLTADEPSALVDAALRLVDASDAEATRGGAFPQLRVGLAYGPAVGRGGDVFGRAVNLASRVTQIARAGSVLATREVRDRAGTDAFSWSSAHARRLKGLPDPVPLYRARPRAAGS
ncbi:MAG TPA: adenylate cyclase regulatory domain-containing protein [Baekduia sp.]|uniref:adenylate/guanylate cyclase domain-containing protein n=1 Tax=Baekduia sp. TaxID=2600305 RepID=UPI002D78173B|nr:adenylate cyclase regulatory domain-containing protein [Baekduia sp.]HET6507423.1 adenylate cyclase regulatory domain-containing protein [Baekduia sp.]